MTQRYAELDALRGIAAIMVVLFHYSVKYGQIYGNPVEPMISFELGYYGVHLFFIISGFVIFLTLDKTRHAADFIVSRFSRLYPAYWFAVILTFSVIYVFSLPGREVGFRSALINLTMLQSWTGAENVDGVYWSLAVELSFYFIMLFLYITKQLSKINLIAIGWLIIIIGSRYLEGNNIIKLHWAAKLFFLLDYGNLFIAGIMFYKIMHGEERINYAILLVALIAEFYAQGKTAFLIAAYFIVFYLFAVDHIKILASKPLIWLGTISYSLYLIHQNIGYVIINEMRFFGILNPVTIIIIPLLTSLLVATLMQRYIEKPSLAFIRNTWKYSRLRDITTRK